MADNYLQFSNSITDLTDDEIAWFKKELDSNMAAKIEKFCDIHGVPKDINGLPKHLHCAMWEYLASESEPFQYKISEQRREFWFYAEEHGNFEAAVDLLQAFLAKFRPDDCASIEYAFTCSKMRIDEFGGGAVFITADETEYISTGEWLAERARSFKESHHTPDAATPSQEG